MENVNKKGGMFQRFLDFVEKSGNKLPHPVTLFFLLAVLTLVASAILSAIGITVVHPGVQNEIMKVNNFAPLGVVLTTMLGIGIAERSGLISAALRGFILAIPKSLITAGLVFAGIMSSLASDAGYVVLPPLGAVIFLALGRHPIAGL